MNAKSIALHLGIAVGAAVIHAAALYASKKAPALSGIVSALESTLGEVLAEVGTKEAVDAPVGE